MRIQIIRTLHEYHRLKPAWDEVYEGDACATITKSWHWMLGWLETTSLNWMILAVEDQQSGKFVAFAPLAYLTGQDGNLCLYFGGYPLSAHTGFLCRQDKAHESITLLSSYIESQLPWDRLFLKDVLDERLPLFSGHYQESLAFNVFTRDQTVCPYLHLPPTWECYFDEFLGKETRKTFRKKLARLARTPKIIITAPDKQTLPAHIDGLLTLREKRWGPRSRETDQQTGAILRSCYNHDSLYMRIIWQGDAPVAGIAAFMDPVKKSAQCFMTAYHASLSRLSPGNILILNSLRYAIENGITLYDFGRGGEDYKFSVFGAQSRHNTNMAIFRLNGLKRARKLLQRTFLDTSPKEEGIDVVSL